MIDVEIRVIGPGGCINAPYEFLKRKLEEVDYENPFEHPVYAPEKLTLDQDLMRNFRVLLVADHRPWGG